jgi:hypothetical protein
MVAKKKTAKSTKKQQESFFTFRWSIETVYWLILSLLVLALGVWVMQLTIQTQAIYDQIQYLNTTS